jgi:class 3 adenylate cyclase
MTFEDMLDQALAMLQRRGRLTYGMLTRQFQLDEEALADLKEALLYTYPEVHDDAGRGLVWTGKAVATPAVSSPTASPQEREPRSYTPSHLAEKILHSRAALEGERKQVTVLFADLKGSMELLAERDPEDARAILDPVLERVMDAVHRYEGTVNQVMGDGIMALFGAPLAHEDHAVRACYAALALQSAIRPYAEEVRRTPSPSVRWRMPVSTRNAATRPMPCACSVTSRSGASLRSVIRLKHTTTRPSLWPKSSACAPSGRAVTAASASSMRRSAGWSRPVPNYRLRLSCTAPWT